MIDLKAILIQHPNCLSSRATFKSVLMDSYPTEKRLLNILTILFECGVAYKIKEKKTIDAKEMQGLISQIENEYGISGRYSQEAILVWATAFDVTASAIKTEATSNIAYDNELVDHYYEMGWQYDVGFMHEQDYQKAAQFYLKAANLGHLKAQSKLAYMYRFGDYFEENDAEAFKWFCKAAAQGDDDALSIVKVQMESDANEWRQKHMTENSPIVVTAPIQKLSPLDMYRIGTVYHHGFRTYHLEKDYAKAAFWWRYAASLGYEPANWVLKVFEDEIQAAESSK